MRGDVLQKFGYKKTLAFGLSISAMGAFLFVPAASMNNYWIFLTALFVVGLGFSVQQIVANPLAIKMGESRNWDAPSNDGRRNQFAGDYDRGLLSLELRFLGIKILHRALI